MITTAQVVELGLSSGLDACGVTTAAVLERARVELHRRRDAGLHNGMKFTYKNPDRSTEPRRTVDTARSIIVGARAYLADPPPRPTEASASVARYAWYDHYAPLKESLGAIKTRLRAEGHRAVVFADDNAVVDREVAYRAGIGWFGKNANLLLPKAGSWFVLGCVMTSAELEPAEQPVADGCGVCRRCFEGCPTDAIVANGVIDANRCLAWLLQKPGTFPVEFRAALGDRLYGCDDCQTVCPPNIRFGRPRSAGPTPATAPGNSSVSGERPEPGSPPTVAWVPLVELLGLSDDDVIARHGRWYIHDRKPVWVRRNALIALGNTGSVTDSAVVATIERYRADHDEVLREHADWALARLHERASRGTSE